MREKEREPAERGAKGAKRLKAVLRLLLLLGLPVLVLFAIFAGGVYFGAGRSQTVVGFEQRWLKIDPPEGFVFDDEAKAAEGDKQTETKAGKETKETETPKTDATPPKTDELPSTDATPPDTRPDTGELPSTDATDTDKLPATDASAPAKVLMPLAVPEALSGPVAQALTRKREVEIKVMVDPAMLMVHEDWLAYVQQLVTAANGSFQRLFGISLRLRGVMLWEQVANTDALLADLATRDREGADVIIGLVARPRPIDYDGPAWDGPENGGYALVFADLDLQERYYRGLLRAVAGLFGAHVVQDQSAAAYIRGSFMSHAPISDESQPPWIDAESRDAIIAHKQRPFAPPRPLSAEEPSPDEATSSSSSEGHVGDENEDEDAELKEDN